MSDALSRFSSAPALDLAPDQPAPDPLQHYVDQLSQLHGFTGALPPPDGWAYAGNPVGTETTQSMGVPSAADNPVAYITASGVPIMRSDLDRAHGQLAQAMQVAPTMALGMVGDAPGASSGAEALRSVGAVARTAVQTGRDLLADIRAGGPNPLGGSAAPDTVRLYHGTSAEGLDAINSEGRVRGPAFFTPDRTAAQRYADDPANVVAVDVPKNSLKIDHDLPGGQLLDVKQSNDYLGPHAEDWTIDDYLRRGYSVGVDHDVSVAPRSVGSGANGLALPGGRVVDARPPSESVSRAMDATFNHGRVVGDRTVPLSSLTGGVALDDPAQAARVARLADNIAGQDGYFARPIVDTDGNVIEGQHRLEALRQLGATDVPVHVVQDLGKGVDEAGLNGAIDAAQKMHPDQRHQLVRNLLEVKADEGSPAAVREAYDPPAGFERAWNAALDFLEGQ